MQASSTGLIPRDHAFVMLEVFEGDLNAARDQAIENAFSVPQEERYWLQVADCLFPRGHA
jgi:hypothetical protein